MIIRAMQREDLKSVLKLADQLGYPLELSAMQKRFDVLEKDTNHALLVATENSEIYGWIHICLEPISLLSDAKVEVCALIVDECARGRGIGKDLLDAASKWAGANQLPLIRIRSDTKRAGAHRFYLREGYKLEKSWHLFTKLVTQ